MNECWSYAGTLIDFLKLFTYVGFFFFSSLSLNNMATQMQVRGSVPLMSYYRPYINMANYLLQSSLNCLTVK